MNIKPSELKNKSLDELEKVSLEEQKNHFNLKVRLSTGQLSETHLLKVARKNIARIKTILNSITEELEFLLRYLTKLLVTMKS